MSSIGKLMKQAARMQQQMEQIQSDLSKRTVEATSGGGAVKVVAKCDGTIGSINGTTGAQRAAGNTRTGLGTGVFGLGSPRQLEFGLQVSF